ncbi:MAG: hypothetical protein R3E62_10355, partial [Pseudomonadales bacterium]
MQKIAAIVFASYGFFIGTDYLAHHVTGFLASDDYPIALTTFLHPSLYIGMCVSGVLFYRGKTFAKHLALACLVMWFYYQFHPLH